jgi:LysR family transcriptional regulator, low CO2-responsive transcriptional regulator
MIRSDRLANFVAFAEALSFTGAARRLRLSQPALHVQIGQLAEEVGAPLYVREGRGLRLTPAGEQLAAFGRELTDRTDRFLAELRGTAAGPVVLCAGEAITRYRLVEGIKAYPEPLRLVIGDAEQAVARVLEGRAHVGVVGAIVPREGLVAETLLEVPQVLAVPIDHPLAGRASVPLAALAGSALIVPPPGRPHREALTRALGDTPWRVAVEVQGWDLMLQLVAAGLGLAVVNGIVPPPAGVVTVPVEELPRVRYDVVLRAGVAPAAAVRRLVEALATPWPR